LRTSDEQTEQYRRVVCRAALDREVIILCVRWYLRYKFSFRDLVEMMAERVLSLAHTTIMRWVRRYASDGLDEGIKTAKPLCVGSIPTRASKFSKKYLNGTKNPFFKGFLAIYGCRWW